MKKIFALIVLLPILVLAQDWAGVQRSTYEAQTPQDRGGVGITNWGEGERIISATGIGVVSDNPINAARERANAMRAAKIVALRDLLEQVKGVQINSTTTIQNFETVDDTIIARVSGVVQGAYEVGSPRYMSDGSIERTFAISLDGQLADAVLTETYNTTVHPGGGDNTGLIIDASGLGAMPAMSPKIVNQSGDVLYGPMNVSRDYAVSVGIVGYARSVDEARGGDRVGTNPMVIRAVSVTGAAKCDLIVSNPDGSKIPYVSGISDCRVTIVL